MPRVNHAPGPKSGQSVTWLGEIMQGLSYADQIRNAFQASRDLAYSFARRDMHADAAYRLIEAYAFARALNVYYANRKDGATMARNWLNTRNQFQEQADWAMLLATGRASAAGLTIELEPNGSHYAAHPIQQ